MAAVGLFGTVLNTKRRRESFLIWAVTNSFFTCYNLFIGEYAQSILFVVNAMISVIGFINWKRNTFLNNVPKDADL